MQTIYQNDKVVFDSTKILILKQFTTYFLQRPTVLQLCLIVQRY